MKPQVNADGVVVFYGGDHGSGTYDRPFMEAAVHNTRLIQDAGGSTIITPKHPDNPDATPADIEAWKEGVNRGRLVNHQLKHDDALGDVITCDLRGVDGSFFDEIRSGKRQGISAGFRRDARAWGWGHVDGLREVRGQVPYMDHFAAFGHEQQRLKALPTWGDGFSETQLGEGAVGLSCFSEGLHTMKTLLELAKALGLAETDEKRREVFAEIGKLDLFAEGDDGDGDGDGDGEEGDADQTPEQVMATLKAWPAETLMSFTTMFNEFSAMLAGGAPAEGEGAAAAEFSEGDLDGLPESTKAAIIEMQKRQQQQADSFAELLESNRDLRTKGRDQDLDAFLTIQFSENRTPPAAQAEVREVAKALIGGADTFSEGGAIAKRLAGLVKAMPSAPAGGAAHERDTTGSTVGGSVDEFSDKALDAEWERMTSHLHTTPGPGAKEAFIRRRKQQARKRR